MLELAVTLEPDYRQWPKQVSNDEWFNVNSTIWTYRGLWINFVGLHVRNVRFCFMGQPGANLKAIRGSMAFRTFT